MIVGNDVSRYLKEVLVHLQTFVDGLVILDDSSNDGTETLCLTQPKLLAYQKRSRPGYAKEPIVLRRELWSMVESVNPEWVFCLEADERFDDAIRKSLPRLVHQHRFDAVRFPLYTLWGDRRHIRIDHGFNPQHNYQLLLHRFEAGLEPHWHNSDISADRCPLEVQSWPCLYSHIRVYHLGWSDTRAIREEPMLDYPLHPAHHGVWDDGPMIRDLTPTLAPWDVPL